MRMDLGVGVLLGVPYLTAWLLGHLLVRRLRSRRLAALAATPAADGMEAGI